MPAITFDGADDNLTLGSNYIYSTNDGLTIFVVVQSTEVRSGTSPYDPMVLSFGEGAEFSYALRYDLQYLAAYFPQDNGVAPNPSCELSHSAGPEWAVVGAGIQFTAEVQTFLNGTTMCSGAAADTTQISSSEIHALPTRSSNGGPVTLGMQSKTANETYRNLKGSLGEVIIWDYWLTPAQREDRECYLAQRFGITLNHSCPP